MQQFNKGEPVVLGFATPIFLHRWPEAERTPVNAALKAAILARRDQTSGEKISNVGGWQSNNDMMRWEVPEVARLKDWINRAYGAVMCSELGTEGFHSRYTITAWANVNQSGDYNRSHLHSNNHWSGVYYVETGRPDPAVMPNGAIEFVDPRPAATVFGLPGLDVPSTWTIHPDAGVMLMFPSWMRHSVLPYRGEGPRISIAFNLRIRELSLKKPGDGAEAGGVEAGGTVANPGPAPAKTSGASK
jgi:uncharacterized protein (TIGR02466 family)